jgi:hypothetical protein
MTAEEKDILNFLKSSPETWFNRREIARKAAGRKAFEEDENWYAAPLSSLLEQELVERDDSGHYKHLKSY